MSSLFSNISSPGIVYRHPDGRYGSAENPEENQQVQSPLYHLNMYQGDIEVNNLTSRFWANIKVFKGLNIERLTRIAVIICKRKRLQFMLTVGVFNPTQ